MKKYYEYEKIKSDTDLVGQSFIISNLWGAFSSLSNKSIERIIHIA